MRVDKLTLTNFRRFDAFTIDLHPQVTVIVGENASGKTSVLGALAIALNGWTSGFKDKWSAHPGLRHSDARRSFRRDAGMPSSTVAWPVKVEAFGDVPGLGDTTWSSSIEGKGMFARRGPDRALGLAATEAEAALVAGATITLPVVAHYGVHRTAPRSISKFIPKAATERDELSPLRSRLSGYADCWETIIRGKHARDWFIWRETSDAQAVLRRLQARRIDGQTSGATEEDVRQVLDQLAGQAAHSDVIRNAVSTLLPGATSFGYDVELRDLVVWFGDDLVPLSQLSDGQQNLASLAADIAWRCVQLNPHLAERAALESPGVVLIDEVGLLLHPKWQQHVLPRLITAFPKIQFVVTTHDAPVVSSCQREWIRVLHEGAKEASLTGPSYGRDANDVLESIFGVSARLPEIRVRLNGLARLIDDDDVDGAREELASLSALIGADDPELVRATWELSDLESDAQAAKSESGRDETD